MKKPLIGLIPSFHNGDIRKPNPMPGCLEGLARAGCDARLILPPSPPAELKAILSSLDGLLLQGGGDADPSRYGAHRIPQCGPPFPQRDEIELLAVKLSVEMDLPLLAICRGAQMVNVALGGTLYQDLPSELGVSHSLGAGIAPDHIVDLLADSLVRRIARAPKLPTNSMHHQSVRTLGDGLIATARHADGVIEALERPASRFLLALQWHPECTLDADACSLDFFHALARGSVD